MNKAALAIAVERARQHQEMVQKYSAYRDMLTFLDDKIAHLDDQWYVQSLDNDALQQLRGQKRALLDVRQSLQSDLDMDIGTAMDQLANMPEEEAAAPE